MQRSGLRPDVVSYTLLISAYGKARKEDEALAVFEEMLNAGVRCLLFLLLCDFTCGDFFVLIIHHYSYLGPESNCGRFDDFQSSLMLSS